MQQILTSEQCCLNRWGVGLATREVMPCGWEGNRRSSVALAMRHRLDRFIQLRAHDLWKGEKHAMCRA